MKTSNLLASMLLLAAFTGCGGGSGAGTTPSHAPSPSPNPSPGPALASSLSYVDPGAGTYQLKRNANLSSNTHLVLELWGPETVQGSGVTLALRVDSSQLSWANVATTDAPGSYVANGSVFELGSGTPILKGLVKGDVLVATVSEKGCGSPKALHGPLLRVALDLKASNLPVGSALALSGDATKSQVLLPDGSTTSIAITTGNLVAQ